MSKPLLLASSSHFQVTGLPALLIILAILALIVIGIVAVVKFIGRRV